MTAAPELRRTQNGTAVASFYLACDRDFKNKETGETEADFINCVAWRGTAEFVSKYFSKGQSIICDGRLEIDEYTDKYGNKRRSAKINVGSVYFAGPKTAQKEEPEDAEEPGFTEIEDTGEDFPF